MKKKKKKPMIERMPWPEQQPSAPRSWMTDSITAMRESFQHLGHAPVENNFRPRRFYAGS